MKIERATRSYSFLCFCLYLEFSLFASAANDSQNYRPTQLCTGHILADAGEREVKFLENWNTQSIA
jgi:hypothetical protein